MADLDALRRLFAADALDDFAAEHYSRDLDSPLCPGNGVEPSREAVRDAFFAGMHVAWQAVVRVLAERDVVAALEQAERLRKVIPSVLLALRADGSDPEADALEAALAAPPEAGPGPQLALPEGGR